MFVPLPEEMRNRFLDRIGSLPPDMESEANEVKTLKYLYILMFCAPSDEDFNEARRMGAELETTMSKAVVQRARRNTTRFLRRHRDGH